jgi:sugar lactone lactonase YvrE
MKRLMASACRIILALAAGLLLAASNSIASGGSTVKNESVAKLVWPQPPDPARIAFVRTIAKPEDLGAKLSTLNRLGNWITGSQKGNEAFRKPFGISFDEQDNLCLTDTGANTVSFFDRSKRQWRQWDQIGTIRFSVPVSMAHSQGTFYVADSGLGSVLMFDLKGKLIRQITNHLERPSGLALSGKRLYLADSARHCIIVFNVNGEYITEFGSRGMQPGQFNFPTHLAVDRTGNLLVTDSMNCRVLVLDSTGKFKSQLGSNGDSPGHFGRPKGVAADAVGNIYAVDALFDNFQLFDPSGKLLLHIGGTGAQPGEFWLPNGIAINHDKEIFVTDSYNHRIQVFKSIGTP